MFNKSGKARFNACSHKLLSITDTEASLSCPQTERSGMAVDTHAGVYQYPENVEKGIYVNRGAALKELGAVAGAMVCRACPFYNMTPVEVIGTLTQEATAKAALLEARANEAQQQLVYQQALAELQGTSTPQQLPPAPSIPEA